MLLFRGSPEERYNIINETTGSKTILTGNKNDESTTEIDGHTTKHVV